LVGAEKDVVLSGRDGESLGDRFETFLAVHNQKLEHR
jgi:hypothetical protein